MKVCYFGTYEKNYPRNRIIIDGLKTNGVEVVELHEPAWEKITDKTELSKFKKIKLALAVLIAYCKLAFRKFKLKKIDRVIVGYLGQPDMIVARILFPTKKILFNPMISFYDTIINDRQLTKNFLSKKVYFYLDKVSCRLADKIILDTREHSDYFQQTFKIPLKKLDWLAIGADEKIFHPRGGRKEANGFNVIFYGKFTPLHGVEYIIKAAKLLAGNKDIKFTVIGSGQTLNRALALARELAIDNIDFIDFLPIEQLPGLINRADICLGGHFGKGDKAKRVVANKVYQLLAMQKPIIMADNPSARNLGFEDKVNAILIPPEDEQAIAEAIKFLKNNPELSKQIAANGYQLFTANFATAKLGQKCLDILEQM